MSDNKDINFHSGDIKKKDLKFNVEEKKSKQFSASLKELKEKFLASPPIKGKNKYITLGAVVIVVALAITLPIVIPKLTAPQGDGTISEEEEEEKQKIVTDTVHTVNDLDPDADDDTKEAILSDLDAKISTASLEDRVFFVQSKSLALKKYGRYEEAIELNKSLIDDLRSGKEWSTLVDVHASISGAYKLMGDKESAIEWMKKTIGVIDEAAVDPESPRNMPGRDFYEGQLSNLENS